MAPILLGCLENVSELFLFTTAGVARESRSRCGSWASRQDWQAVALSFLNLLWKPLTKTNTNTNTNTSTLNLCNIFKRTGKCMKGHVLKICLCKKVAFIQYTIQYTIYTIHLVAKPPFSVIDRLSPIFKKVRIINTQNTVCRNSDFLTLYPWPHSRFHSILLLFCQTLQILSFVSFPLAKISWILAAKYF